MATKLLITLTLLGASVGCDRWRDPDPTWTIGATGPRRDVAAAVHPRAAPDGETIVVVGDGEGMVTFGDRTLDGPHLARIGRDGSILEVAAVDDGTGAVRDLAIDARGRLVVAWGSGDGGSLVVAYDEALTPRWSVAVTNPYADVFDVGPDGQVAYHESLNNGGGPNTLRYLGDDSVERWAVPLSCCLRRMVVANDGDVIVYSEDRRWRFAASDGALAENVAAPAIEATTSDGVELAVEPYPDESGRASQLILRERSGEIRWTRVVEGRGYCPFGGCLAGGEGPSVQFGPTDRVILTLYQTRVLHLDGATGDPLGDVDHCGAQSIHDVDEDGYLAVGPICDQLPGLARYPAP